ncbi:MAG: hypothetical protein ACI8T1_004576 [Verrucomicrobiales bacterium]|jgi:hypothetical protein
MCTLTWRHESEGYHLFFNRDERKTRQPEEAPAIIEDHDLPLIAPKDGDHSGTWLAVNACGVTYALLNHYDLASQQPEPPQPLSRGVLPLLLAGAKSPEDRPRDLQRFRPFHLVRVTPNGTAQHGIWDGDTWTSTDLTESDRPLTTSSFDSGRAVELRKQAFTGLGPSPEIDDLATYHRSTSPHGSAYGVLMRRPDAQTMSITHIHVTPKEVTVHYEPQPRDGEDVGESCALRMARL